MLKKIIFVLLFSPLTVAQLTQVSGTIKDPSGLPYSNGTISATLVISGTPRFTFNSLPYTPPSAPVGLDATGSFVMSLGDVNQLTPSGGTWSFHICSAVGTVQPGSPITSGPVCFDAPGFIITGTAVNISTQLSLAAPPLTSPSVTGVTNPITVPSPTASLPSITGSAGLGWQLNAACCATAGVPSIWAVAANSPGTTWFPIPYIVVNGLTPANLSAQNFVSTTAPPTNGLNVTWARTGPTGANSSQQQISAALVGDGIVTDCYLGTGVFGPCLQTNALQMRIAFSACASVGAGTTCSVTYAGGNFYPPGSSSFTTTPICSAVPTTAGGSNPAALTNWFAAVTTTGITFDWTPSSSQSFSFICMGF